VKIAYICHWDPFVEDGVGRKIRSQATAWRELGAEVEVFFVSKAFVHETPLVPLHSQWFLYRNPYWGRVAATIRLGRAVDRWRPDVIYVRYTLFLPPPARLMHKFPTVIEINTDDRAEYRLRSHVAQRYNEISRRVVLRSANGFVGVTPELAEQIAPRNVHARRTCITNGIDLGDFEVFSQTENSRSRLVFLASAPDPWHGIDKIIWLASALPEFDFDLIGQQESGNTSIPKNVNSHGFCSRLEYEALLSGADVAIGTLALHRKRMSQATPLKVREYLSRGIPVIIGYDDPDLADRPWFVLQLPNTERNVQDAVAEIRDFVRSVAGRRVGRDEVRNRIDILAKERERLEFLEAIATSSTQPR
jgi:glycosyltransferase involved in cell wall biosynthesis